MPELPEVETIRRQLAPHIEGRTITQAEILDPRWTRPEAPGAVASALHGAAVERIGRRGKYLVWSLAGDRHLLVHLRMTGTLLFDPPTEPVHTRVRLVLDDGHQLVYVDPRRFGTGHLLLGAAARDAYLALRLGVEPFTPEFTAEHLRKIASGRTAPVKAFVIDQRRLAGVGNIYADEALFRAGIHPLRPTGRLTLTEWARMRDSIEDALGAGIEAKGASIDDFRHIDGARGSFQDRFLVHRREGEPCPRCQRPIRKIVVGGRGTYVCEGCQRKPRAAQRSAPGARSGSAVGSAPVRRSAPAARSAPGATRPAGRSAAPRGRPRAAPQIRRSAVPRSRSGGT
jgi:formamidopyrimidine-DNA glycosylase